MTKKDMIGDMVVILFSHNVFIFNLNKFTYQF